MTTLAPENSAVRAYSISATAGFGSNKLSQI
jgi:hypothetical protein